MSQVITFPVSAQARQRLRRMARRHVIAETLRAAGPAPLPTAEIIRRSIKAAPDARPADVVAATREARSPAEVRALRRHVRRPRR